MFKIDDREIKKLENDLMIFAHRSIPFATKNTVNTAAFLAMRISRKHVKEKMIIRNQFTVKSIQVEQSRTLNINRQAAVVGSTADYMEDQEFGGVKRKRGKEGLPIATSYSAGQGEDTQPRLRLPRKQNRLVNIKLKHKKNKSSNRKQRNIIAIKTAASTKKKHVFLDLGKRKGIFKITGVKRKPKVKMVHDMTNKSVVIPPNPWLLTSVLKVKKDIPEIYRKSLEFQARRQGLF